MSQWFMEPARLWLLLAVMGLIAIYVAVQWTRPKYTVRFSNLELLDKVAPRRPGWRRHLVAGLFSVALALLVVAFAQPVMEIRVPKERSTLILAIDTSLSMAATDVAPTRLRAAQDAAQTFVDALPSRLNVGLVSFAGTARLVVPPTQDRAQMRQAIRRLKLDKATAIGDAVKLSVEVAEDQSIGTSGKRPDVAVVLLSDGETTVGLPTEAAIPIARKARVPISTIAYGTPNGQITVDEDGDGVGQVTRVPVNVRELAGLAQGTNGRAYAAESATDLREVYKKLGSTVGYQRERSDVAFRFVGASLIVLLVAAGLSLRWFSRLP
ncbi:MAG: VWA domain-containing protein [Actinomycetes bacterium]